MRRIVRQAMEEGAVGISSGLDYIPSRYAQTEELAELCREIAPYGGVYVTHMRGYAPDNVIGAMDEVFRIAREAGVAALISHFNSRADLVLPHLDRARASGLDVAFDLYGYLAGSTILGMIALPPWVQEGGADATLARLRRSRGARPAPGRGLLRAPRPARRRAAELRRGAGLSGLRGPDARRGGAPRDRPRRRRRRSSTSCATCWSPRRWPSAAWSPHQQRAEGDVTALMRHPAMMGGSDGIFAGGRPASRAAGGASAATSGHYVREARTWTLEEAVQHLAAHPARRLGLGDRGLIRPGMAADLVVFDADRVGDRATYADGRQPAEGVDHVLVNGELVLLDGQRTPALPGRALRPARA